MQFSGSVPPSSPSPGLLYYSTHTHVLMPTPSIRLYHFTSTPSPRQTLPDTSTPPSHVGEFGSGGKSEGEQDGGRNAGRFVRSRDNCRLYLSSKKRKIVQKNDSCFAFHRSLRRERVKCLIVHL